ncbi:ribonuclease [Mycolicibacterium thermoresistibile]|nr:ribonuclease [Mycolicibacterium thermoresistibile]
MADSDETQASTESLSTASPPAGNPVLSAGQPQPERLRVHSLARALGTTSRQVLDVLSRFDGRVRSAHSTVGPEEADRVREVLAAGPEDSSPEDSSTESAGQGNPGPEDAGPEDAGPEETGPQKPEPTSVDPIAAPIEPQVDPPDSAVEPVPPAVTVDDPPAEDAAASVEVTPTEVTDGPVSGGVEAAAPEAPETFQAQTTAHTTAQTAAPQDDDRPDYLPLFVAPKPIQIDIDDEDDGFDDLDDDRGDDRADTGPDGDDDQGGRPTARRRRRGRRGRGRGRGEQSGDDADGDSTGPGGGDTEEVAATAADQRDADQSDESDDGSDDSGDDESTTTEGTTRRRRRRRRRKSGSGDDTDNGVSPDDPPNTVVHERVPRTEKEERDQAHSEIQGITGSTRLEAKRQRRRDGRDAGRRRPPILSEAEFLARREAVERVMVVRDKVRTEPPHQGARYTQIAVLEDGVVVEHFVTSSASASLVGNIYLGIVQNVLPSMEAAFVDIGRGRNGVLYAGEVNWEAAGLGGQNRKIEQALKPGDYVVVQVSKDPVGHKGARLTTQLSLAGRYLVYVPGATSTGISRKLPDTERQRLKEILREVVPPDAGVIIRTASEGVKEEDIRADVNRLQERWTQIEAKAAELTEKKAGQAVALYEEPDVLVKVIRDLFNEDFSRLIVSGDHAWNTINEYVSTVAPDLMPRLTKYEPASEDGPDVFAVHRIDEQLAKAMDRKVWLPSGGTLVIDRTEAMTVIDVNTGKFTGSGGNLEQTVTRNNLEAAEEIVRQLRLRDIGGIVVIDFIDMVLESNRDLVLRRLTEALARDRTRHQVSEVTSLGLVQLTRKRLGTGLLEAFSTTCTHCNGRGIVLHTDPVDSAQPSRRSDSGSRRSKRSKRSRSDDVQVVKVPPHPPGEHPLFKAMAAASERADSEAKDDTEETGDGGKDAAKVAAKVKEKVAAEDRAKVGAQDGVEEATPDGVETEAAAATRAERVRTAVSGDAQASAGDLDDEDLANGDLEDEYLDDEDEDEDLEDGDLENGDLDDEDDDEDLEDGEIDVDLDEDLDDDIEVLNGDPDDEEADEDVDSYEDPYDADADADSDSDADADDEDSGDDRAAGRYAAPTVTRRPRRRAAVRPAGPPVQS